MPARLRLVPGSNEANRSVAFLTHVCCVAVLRRWRLQRRRDVLLVPDRLLAPLHVPPAQAGRRCHPCQRHRGRSLCPGRCCPCRSGVSCHDRGRWRVQHRGPGLRSASRTLARAGVGAAPRLACAQLADTMFVCVTCADAHHACCVRRQLRQGQGDSAGPRRRLGQRAAHQRRFDRAGRAEPDRPHLRLPRLLGTRFHVPRSLGLEAPLLCRCLPC